MAKKLRVLMVVDGFYPSVGGAEIQAGLLAAEFKSLGHDVSILAPLLDRTMTDKEIVDGIHVERIRYPEIKIFGAIVVCAKFGWKLLRDRNQYDVVHIHMVKNLATVAGMLRPLHQIRVICKISGAWEFNGGILDKSKIKKPIYKIINFFVKQADYIQSISKYTRDTLLASGYPASKILMIPNGVDLSRFSTHPKATIAETPSTNLTYVGRVEHVKGIDILIEAAAKVILKHPLTINIAGDGLFLDQLRQLANRLGITSSINFLGAISNVPELLSKTDIYVQPSRQEGLPNSVLEAMAMNLPIVATRVSGNEDLVVNHENGLLVPSENVDEMAKAIEFLVENPASRKELGARSRQIIEEQYALKAVAIQLEHAYRGYALEGNITHA